ncbi:polysaccharide deacetylase [Fibrella sp. HMF5335]|uniref:Polysaccharide deacetylase n=1 Tax=Fibrella rubiginis TaxID=2817060 RepID=A0A939K573_9BACT|nr:polysaccharide deacetylase [Fibrella rubiginis]MBO0936956.1 polysaccharide deacetylase [Fibrella rubiginis]
MLHYLLIPLFILLTLTNAAAQLTDYKVYFGVTARSPEQLVLRQWRQNGQTRFLLLDPRTLETSVADLPPEGVRPRPWSVLEMQLANTAYGRAMHAEKQRDSQLQDAGISRADTTEQGFSLTIDLCPSSKPLTRSVFEAIIQAFEPSEKPIPVTIPITGVWMARHQPDLAYLKNLASRGDLAITWVNHSYHHRFDPRRPLPVNFLLEPNTSLADEVLLNEQAMIQNGLLPSVFFRFPGLVSDKAVFDAVLDFGLLPIGSDAWLAKKQQPKQGSFVLIHANGNEPLGIADFVRLIRQKAASIKNKTWLLYELPRSVANGRGVQ